MSKPTLTTYGGALRERGYAGMIPDLNDADIENYLNSGAAGIDFGVAVGRAVGDADNTVKAIAADTDIPSGISARHATMVYDGNGAVLYAQYQPVPTIRKGFVLCLAAENVTRGTQALSITANGGQLGGVSAGAAGAGRVAFPAKYNVTWEETTLAGKLGLVRIVS